MDRRQPQGYGSVLSQTNVFLCSFFLPTFSLSLSLSSANPPPPVPDFRPMGRKTWCSTEQTEFLKVHLSRLDEEKNNHGLSPFYARVAAEFIKRWESPTPKKACPKGVSPKQHADNERTRVSGFSPFSWTDADHRHVSKLWNGLGTVANSLRLLLLYRNPFLT